MATPAHPFTIAPGEHSVAMTPAGNLRGFRLTGGRVWLTTERLVFQPVVLWVFWLAPLVGLVLWLMHRGQSFELPLSTITTHRRAKFGRNPNVLHLTTTTGADHKLIIDKFDSFTAALTSLPTFTAKALTSP